MKGSPAKLGTIRGTSGHASALKMKASVVKQIGKKGLYASDKSWAEGQATSEEMGGSLNEWVAERKKHKRGSNEYNKLQNKINEALGNKKRYPVTEEKKVEEEKSKTIVEKRKEKGTKERADIVTEEEEKMAKKGPTEKVTYKTDSGLEVTEEKGGYGPAYEAETKQIKSQQKEDRDVSSRGKKVTKATYGRKSEEYKEAKKSHKELKSKQERQRRQNVRDQKANKAQEIANQEGATQKQKDKAAKLTKKAEDFATKTDYKKTWWNPFD